MDSHADYFWYKNFDILAIPVKNAQMAQSVTFFKNN